MRERWVGCYLKETVKGPQARLVSGAVWADHVDKNPFLQEAVGHAEAKVTAVEVLPDPHLETQLHSTQ